jgi:hypothetical protein
MSSRHGEEAGCRMAGAVCNYLNDSGGTQECKYTNM